MDYLNIINLIVTASIAILALLAYYKGTRMLLTGIISFYPASLLYMALPIKDKMLFLGTEGPSLFYSHAFIWGVLFLISFFAIYKITQYGSLGFGAHKLINAILIGASFTMLVIAIGFHVLPSYNIFQLTNADITSFWTSDWGYVLALFVPLIAIWRVGRGGSALKI